MSELISYKRPKKRIYKSFVYLNDDLVTNSLSAIESGQIDEIVSRGVMAREGGLTFHAALNGGVGNASGTAGKKNNSEYEEELLKTRTRFSIFETWLSSLREEDAIGIVESGGAINGAGICVGDLIEVTGRVELREIFSLVRAFFDYAQHAKTPGHPFYVKGESQKETAKAAELFKHIFGKPGNWSIPAQIKYEEFPDHFSFTLSEKWLIDEVVKLPGNFTVIGQVKEVLNEGEWSPSLRIMPKTSPNEFERQSVKNMLGELEQAAQPFGFSGVREMGEFSGPCVILEPVAVYR